MRGGKIEAEEVGRETVRIYHMQFAKDTILIFSEDENEFKN